MRKFHWTPNFYIILVGPPGVVTKSTTTNAGLTLLAKAGEIAGGIIFGPESGTWQGLGDAFASATEYIKYKDRAGADQTTPMSAITCNVSELGTFLMADDPKFLPFLIEMWDAKVRKFIHKTKSSGNIEIPNPWLNLIACTTPTGLRDVLPLASIGGGFTSRVVFVFGDKKRHLIPYPDEVIPEAEYYATEKKLIEDLIEIASLAGEYALSPDARAWGHSWYGKHWNGGRNLHMASERYEGYLARKQTHIHKLAIILAAARSNTLVIEKQHLEEAEAVLSLVEPHMLKAFESVGVVDEAKHVAEIVAFVRAHKILTSNQLWSLVMQIMPQKDFKEAVIAAVNGGLLKVVPHPNAPSEKALVPNTPSPGQP